MKMLRNRLQVHAPGRQWARHRHRCLVEATLLLQLRPCWLALGLVAAYVSAQNGYGAQNAQN